MKRLLVIVLSLGLLVGSGATADAKKRPTRVERTVLGKYSAYPSPVTGCNSALGSYACLIVLAGPTETFFTAKVTDAHGQPVFVEVVRPGGRPNVVFCGETTEPLEISPRSHLQFFVGLNNWPGDINPADCPASRVKTTGTIRVTLSNLP